MYYNGTSARFWWNQNAEAVCVYAPVPRGFDPQKVDFVAKSRHVSLKLDGEEVSLRSALGSLGGRGDECGTLDFALP